MRWRVILTTNNHEALLKALGKTGVEHEVCAIANNAGKRPLSGDEAMTVYSSYATGLSARAVAEKHGVSLPTVQRVVSNPAGYGLSVPAIRRGFRGRPQ